MLAPSSLPSSSTSTSNVTAHAQANADAIALAQPLAKTVPAVEGTLSLHRIAATLQVVLATRRAARDEEHAYWYTVARGM
jgi:hypothetical protein